MNEGIIGIIEYLYKVDFSPFKSIFALFDGDLSCRSSLSKDLYEHLGIRSRVRSVTGVEGNLIRHHCQTDNYLSTIVQSSLYLATVPVMFPLPFLTQLVWE